VTAPGAHQKVRILHLINSLGVGGTETMLTRLVKGMDRERFHNHVVTLLEPGPLAEDLRDADIAVEGLGVRRGFFNPVIPSRLRRRVADLDIHILQSWLYHADLLAALVCSGRKSPVLLWNIRGSLLADRHYSWRNRLVRRLTARLSKRPAAIIINSRTGIEVHSARGYRPKEWRFIPNGFDTSLFRPDPQTRAAVRCELGISPDTFVIGLTARFHPEKDHETFLKGAAGLARSHQRVAFLLVGKGLERDAPEITRLVEKYAPDAPIHFLGRRADMPRVYNALDVATLCSTGEGFPNVVGEAMACGVPCVVTSVGDNAAIVGDTGRLISPGAPQELVSAWENLIALDREARLELGERARARIEKNYSLPAVIERYQALYVEKCSASNVL
jgi:glycosyltransferase involved in cell wall biosynthesis